MVKQAKKTTTKKVVDTEVSFLLKQNVVHALAYVPYGIGAVSMYFLGRTNKEAAMHHITYSWIIAVAAILWHIFLTGSIIGWLIFPLYMVWTWILAWKAYNGEDISIEILDTVEEKLTKK